MSGFIGVPEGGAGGGGGDEGGGPLIGGDPSTRMKSDNNRLVRLNFLITTSQSNTDFRKIVTTYVSINCVRQSC